MKVIFTRLAKQELDDASLYYEMQIQGLGKRFRKEVKKAALRISDYPKAWSVEAGEIRRCILSAFPYKLLYSIEKDFILIIAVAHLHRKPEYWVDRM
jgi:plasmid stabilization system protein ParE